VKSIKRKIYQKKTQKRWYTITGLSALNYYNTNTWNTITENIINKYECFNRIAVFLHFENKGFFSPSCTKKHLCGLSRYGVVFKRVHRSSSLNSTGLRFIINFGHNNDASVE
jgi:hypothetical protein